MKLIILQGLPASGKSTFAKEYVKENKDFVRVNRDDLRNMRGVYWLPKQEDLITQWENFAITSSFDFGLNVILDATNLNKDRNKHRVAILREKYPNLKVEWREFYDVSVEDCIKRDLERPNSVGEKVIRNMYEQYLAPKQAVYGEDTRLPRCVIFDVDGTLAKMNGRTPFEWNKVDTDLVKQEIAELARTFYRIGKKVIIFTGRDGICLQQTEKWLTDNSIPYDGIYIRPEGNGEKDSIIKKRLFEDNIRGKYFCELVIDDRNQVVDMWRKELGLTCLQVDYGDF